MVETGPVRAVVIYESLTGNTRRAAQIIGRELSGRGIATTVCPITAVDLQALSGADLVVVGTWTDGMFFFGQRPGRAGRLRDRLPAMRGKKAATFITFALEPRKALDKLSDIVRATGAEVIGGMAIRRDDLDGGARDLAERLLEAADTSAS
jgi:flavodoxin